jgi:sugar O-acyltransferase (sialic acid O-acetyltransferase NeuD family)
MMERIVLFGGGGHCASVIDAIRSVGGYDVAGVIDSALPMGDEVLGVSVIGSDGDLPRLRSSGVSGFLVTVGSIGDASVRAALVSLALAAGLTPVSVIHGSAVVSPQASVAPGAFVGAVAYVGPRATVGENAIINSGAIIDHDCRIGSLAHVASGAVLSGNVVVGQAAHVGAGASVSQGVSIGERAIIGTGSVVVSDVPPDVTAFGNPCREVES